MLNLSAEETSNDARRDAASGWTGPVTQQRSGLVYSAVTPRDDRQLKVLRWAGGNWYAGECSAEQNMDGCGVFHWSNGNSFVGQLQNARRHGFGIFTWANGEKFQGEFLNDQRIRGIYTFCDGRTAAGQFSDDKLVRPHVYDVKQTEEVASLAQRLAESALESEELGREALHGHGSNRSSRPSKDGAATVAHGNGVMIESERFISDPSPSTTTKNGTREISNPTTKQNSLDSSRQRSQSVAAPGDSSAGTMNDPARKLAVLKRGYKKLQDELKTTQEQLTQCKYDLEEARHAVSISGSASMSGRASMGDEALSPLFLTNEVARDKRLLMYQIDQLQKEKEKLSEDYAALWSEHLRLKTETSSFSTLQQRCAELERIVTGGSRSRAGSSQDHCISSMGDIGQSSYASMLKAGLVEYFACHDFADILFIVEGEQIRAHALILAIRSMYFRNLLEPLLILSRRRHITPALAGDDDEGDSILGDAGADHGDATTTGSGGYRDGDKNSDGLTIINITRAKPAAFVLILDYLYTDNVDIPVPHCLDVIVLATTYRLLLLKDACEKVLIKSLTCRSVCDVLLESDRFNCDVVKDACYRFILDNYVTLTKSFEFCQIPVPLAEEIFRRRSSRPLHAAITCGREDVVLAMLYKDADIHQRDDAGQTPLQVALWRVDDIARDGSTDMHPVSTRHRSLSDSGDGDGRRRRIADAVALADMLVKLLANINSYNDSVGRSLLHEACAEGRCEAVSFLLRYKVDTERLTRDGKTFLDVACEYGHDSIVDILLQHGISKSCYNNPVSGNTILHDACTQGLEHRVEMLLSGGFDVKCVNNDGETPLHLSAKHGHEAIVYHLLEHDHPVDPSDAQGWTPLRTALWNNQDAVASMLCSVGADVNICSDQEDEEGDAMLHIALRRGLETVALFLINHDANVNLTNLLNQTPLDIAFKYSDNFMDDSIIDKLLFRGAQSLSVDDNGNTLLHRACMDEKVDRVSALLSSSVGGGVGKSRLVDSKNHDGQIPLHIASSRGSIQIVAKLLTAGADVNIKDTLGRAALHLAFEHDNVVTLLLSHSHGDDVAVNSQDNSGNTPLHYAVLGSNAARVVRVLLEHDVSPTLRNSRGWTSLHMLCSSPFPHKAAVATLLLQHGTDVSVQDVDGNMAIHLAAGVIPSIPPSEELAVFLVVSKCPLNVPNHDGYTPLDRVDETLSYEQRVDLTRIRCRLLECIVVKPTWLLDSQINACQLCHSRFRMTMRKHHCRMCGRIICKNCSLAKRCIPKIGEDLPVRVCNDCLDVIEGAAIVVAR